MLDPTVAIRMGTNRCERNSILNLLLAGQALGLAGGYYFACQRTGLSTVPSILFSATLVTSEYAALHSARYMYKQRKISYSTAIFFSEIGYLLSKIVIVSTLVFSKVILFSEGALTVGLLIPGITRAGDNALLFTSSGSY